MGIEQRKEKKEHKVCEKQRESGRGWKAEIEKRFSVEWMVEYVLLMNLLQDGDSISKNIQWATWGAIDGTVKWYPLPYDLDGASTLHAKWTANKYDVVLNARGGSGGSTVTAVFDSDKYVIKAEISEEMK